MSTGAILLVEDNDDDVALVMRAVRQTGIRNEVVRAFPTECDRIASRPGYRAEIIFTRG